MRTAASRRAFVRAALGSGAALALAGWLRRPLYAGAPVSQEVVIPPPPMPKRTLARDQDGSLTPSFRARGEIAPLITPIASFYVTTKNAGGDPVLSPDSWRLVVDGAVNRPVQLDLPLLYQLPAVEINKTLECISNWVTGCDQVPFGCDLISTAVWKGARLSDVLALAGGLQAGVASIAISSFDEFSSSIPADAATLDETLLVYEMNREVLPLEHGYPARLLLPGRYGMKSAKWVVNIRPMTSVFVDWYGQRGWSQSGLVQTMSRIDTPFDGQVLPAGPSTVAGIAYAGSRGIGAVEYSADGGRTWTAATFTEDRIGLDTWVRWQGSFPIRSGEQAQLVCRATDGVGNRQDETVTPTEPNGATGLHVIGVSATG